mgnify:CR=1 FL=1
MADYIKILGIKINKLDLGQAIKEIDKFIISEGNKYVVTPNSEMIVMAQKDKKLAHIINNSDLSVPDGAGVVLASKLNREKLSERVAGFDLMGALLNLASEEGYSIYLLGSKPGIVDITRDKILLKYPDLEISGIHHGYLDKGLQKGVIEEINHLKPDILFVGMGVPLQEEFIYNNISTLRVKIAMTVGGSFDVLAEKVNRAPIWMQRLNLEWLFRLIQEPRRIGRMTALPKFVYMVLMDYIKTKIY